MPNGKHGHVVDYRHVIHALQRKPMALLGLVYRDQLFPRQAYARPSRRCSASLPARAACRTMVDLLALAHERACEAELADAARRGSGAGRLPDINELARPLRAGCPAQCPRSSSPHRRSAPTRSSARVRSGRGGMKAADPIDAARLTLALNDLRLPAHQAGSGRTSPPDADKEGWPAARFLAALAEHEMAERARRRIERHLDEARLPPGKTLDSFDFDAVPMISKAQVMALAAGDSWLDKGANLLMFGPPGGGKSHLGGRPRPGPGGERLARAVRPHHRSGAEAADRAPRPAARGGDRPTRQVSPPDPR